MMRYGLRMWVERVRVYNDGVCTEMWVERVRVYSDGVCTEGWG